MTTVDPAPQPAYELPDMQTHTLAGLTSLGGLPDHASREGNAVWWEGKGYATRVEVETLPDPEGKRRAEVRIVSRLTEATLPVLSEADIGLVNYHAGVGALRRRADGGLEMAGAAVIDQSINAMQTMGWLMAMAQACRVMGEGGLGLIYCTLVDPGMSEAWRSRLGVPRAWQYRPEVGELEYTETAMAERGFEAWINAESVLLNFSVPMAERAGVAARGGPAAGSVIQVGLGPGHVHPLFGPGYRAHADTTLPGAWTLEETVAFAESLNVGEQQRLGWWVPRLGAWRASGAGALAYESRVGTEVPWPKMVEQLAEGMVERVMWMEEVIRRRNEGG